MSKKQERSLIHNTGSQIAEQQSAQHKLRLAAYNGISEQDMKEIVQNQVAKAKAGDAKALQFVMDTLLGGSQHITLTQENHHHYEGGSPPPAIDAPQPGSSAAIEAHRNRIGQAANGRH